MLRVLIRLAGLLILAGAFASVVIDGSRSIAGDQLSLTPVSALLGGAIPALKTTVTGHLPPLVWDRVVVWLLALPVWGVLAAAGLFLLWLVRPRAPGVGLSTRA